MKSKNRILESFFLVVLIACASSGPGRVPEGTAESSINGARAKTLFLFEGQRKVAALPCGCSVAPMGGVERSNEALKKLRANADQSFYLSGGPAFVDGAIPKNGRKTHNAKAELLVDMLNQLELTHYFPSAEDFVVDAKTLNSLIAKSKFQWVASNLVPKSKETKLNRFAEVDLKSGGAKALIVGISRKPARWLVSSDVKVEDPIKALKNLFAEKKPEAYSLVILVSNLDAAGRDKVLAAYPFIHVSLDSGADSKTANLNVAQEGALRLIAAPEAEGKTLAFIRILDDVAKKPVQFYSHSTVKMWENLTYQWKEKQYDAEGKRLESKAAKDKKRWLAERAKWDRLLAWAPDVMEKKEGATNYDSGIFSLDASYEVSNSPLKPLTTKFKEILAEEKKIQK